MRYSTGALIGLAALIGAAGATAQPIIYPGEGQSAQQQQKDEGECHAWATQNTGIDPAALAAAPQQTGSTFGSGDRAAGAVRGAAGGALIGAIAGDTGKGAGIGAVAGTMAGGRRARQNQSAQNQQSQAQRQGQLDTYNRAVGACLEARGYTVK